MCGDAPAQHKAQRLLKDGVIWAVQQLAACNHMEKTVRIQPHGSTRSWREVSLKGGKPKKIHNGSWIKTVHLVTGEVFTQSISVHSINFNSGTVFLLSQVQFKELIEQTVLIQGLQSISIQKMLTQSTWIERTVHCELHSVTRECNASVNASTNTRVSAHAHAGAHVGEVNLKVRRKR